MPSAQPADLDTTCVERRTIDTAILVSKVRIPLTEKRCGREQELRFLLQGSAVTIVLIAVLCTNPKLPWPAAQRFGGSEVHRNLTERSGTDR